MADTIVARIAEVAGPRGARAFEWVNGGVRVKEATPLVGGEGNAKETNKEDTEEAGKVGGQRLEVVVQEAGGGAKMGGAGKEMVIEVGAVLTSGGLGREGRAPSEAFDDQSAFDVFWFQGVERERTVPVHVQRT